MGRKIKSRLGETSINNRGFAMKIIKYKNSHDIDVEFENGYIAHNIAYDNFKKGAVLEFSAQEKYNRVGEFKISNQNMGMKIIKYNNAKNIDVQFDDGYVVHNREYREFKKGAIENPNIPSLYNIGYKGVGKYKTKENNKTTVHYSKWSSMLCRCYDDKILEERPTYEKCSVCAEWLNFQNFAKWYDENLWSDSCTYLDKDILVRGNKLYSPDTCVLVDNRLNCLFLQPENTNKTLPIGVRYNKGKYICSLNIINYSKTFSTIKEAKDEYAYVKQKYIKEVADEYKAKYNNFPQKLYEAMYNWCVYDKGE